MMPINVSNKHPFQTFSFRRAEKPCKRNGWRGDFHVTKIVAGVDLKTNEELTIEEVHQLELPIMKLHRRPRRSPLPYTEWTIPIKQMSTLLHYHQRGMMLGDPYANVDLNRKRQYSQRMLRQQYQAEERREGILNYSKPTNARH